MTSGDAVVGRGRNHTALVAAGVVVLAVALFGALWAAVAARERPAGVVALETGGGPSDGDLGADPGLFEVTSTTVDPLAVERFLVAWRDAETAAAAEAAAVAEVQQRQRGAVSSTTTVRQGSRVASSNSSSGAGGGCVIPAYICQRESGFNYGALNRSSGAGGMYQFLPSTWDAVARRIAPEWVGTPPHLAPPAVQDRFAAWLWDGGRGCSHWSAC